MQSVSRRVVGSLFAGVLLALISADPVAALSQGGPDPLNFDVAGVRLGMPANDAMAALKKFDPKYAVTKKYYAQPFYTYGNAEGQDFNRLVGFDKSTGTWRKIAYLYYLIAERRERVDQCVYTSGEKECGEQQPVDTVIVWVSPIPGQERVIAVQRKATFYKEPHPAIGSLKGGIFAKYPRDQVTYQSEGPDAVSIDWLFDSQRHIMSAASAKRRNRYSTRGALPQDAYAGDGIGLGVNFEPNNQNYGLADSMSITLYDGNALFRSIEQSQATYKALKAKSDAEDVAKSRGQNQPKF